MWKERKHTVAADVYSFGITLWEIFTKGIRPFEELDDKTVVRRVRTNQPLLASILHIEKKKKRKNCILQHKYHCNNTCLN